MLYCSHKNLERVYIILNILITKLKQKQNDVQKLLEVMDMFITLILVIALSMNVHAQIQIMYLLNKDSIFINFILLQLLKARFVFKLLCNQICVMCSYHRARGKLLV